VLLIRLSPTIICILGRKIGICLVCTVFFIPLLFHVSNNRGRSKGIYNCPCLRLASSAGGEGAAAGTLLRAARREKQEGHAAPSSRPPATNPIAVNNVAAPRLIHQPVGKRGLRRPQPSPPPPSWAHSPRRTSGPYPI
jgi:hypothetical protein